MRQSKSRVIIRFIVIASLSVWISPVRTNAQRVGTCLRSLGEAYLDINNVRARIVNTGGLFYRGEPWVYEVPRFSNKHSVFAGGLWIAGQINGQLRIAAARYSNNEFWAGPLDDDGNPPRDCTIYDRLYNVRKTDIIDYETTGQATNDLRAWPTGLGAPTVDSNGELVDLSDLPFSTRVSRTIKLEAGERPLVIGEQSIWWIMNDRGNEHRTTKVDAIGIEVHTMALGASTTIDAVHNTTYYRYRIINRNNRPLENAYLGLFLDPDLGELFDDYMGSDSLLSLGFVYNADNDDEGDQGYGTAPPAVGVQFIETPHAENDGIDNNWDGRIDEAGENLGLSYFNDMDPYFGAEDPLPLTAKDYYRPLSGVRRNGQPFTLGGDGKDPKNRPIRYLYPGDPTTAEFWSEVNIDGQGAANQGGDRRFLMSTGPFRLEPGEETELVFSVVWARGKDHLDSVTELKTAVEMARTAYENGFINLPSGEAPDEIVSLVSPSDGVIQQPTDHTFYWDELSNAPAYELELITPDTLLHTISLTGSAIIERIGANEIIGWRVRVLNTFGSGPWSATRWFSTGENSFDSAEPFTQIIAVQNNSGPLNPPDLATLILPEDDLPRITCPDNPSAACSSPTHNYQQSTTSSVWLLQASEAKRFGPLSDGSSFLARVTRNGENLKAIGRDDYEIRFTRSGGKALRLFDDQTIMAVPFELWNIGEKTPDDTSDDVRLIPAICEEACSAGTLSGRFDFGGDHELFGDSVHRPSDWIFWYEPAVISPGDKGYQSFFQENSPLGREIFANMILIQVPKEWPFDLDQPEVGTVFRIVTGDRIVPVLASPADYGKALLDGTSFYWSGPKNDRFRLQVSVWPDFHTTVLDTSDVTSGFEFINQRTNTYFWRVESTLNGWSDTWRFRLVSDQVSVEATRRFAPVILYDNFPNPFSQNTSFSYFTPIATDIRLEIFDLLGRSVTRLVDETVSPGRHEVQFDPGGLSSGVYFYSLSTSEGMATKKMILVR
ncbi:MAG: hypothetical protein BMS9Abin05_2217 [Rhodothermia bacterium]|nr:MAG: hypothetical protein BMS9Abin05_2217 [Rhodothermia bacterium]